MQVRGSLHEPDFLHEMPAVSSRRQTNLYSMYLTPVHLVLCYLGDRFLSILDTRDLSLHFKEDSGKNGRLSREELSG